jgi:zinc transport system ATP-binding protein
MKKSTAPKKFQQIANHHPIIRIQDVNFAYNPGTLVLKDITFDIHEGDFLGIIGPNGGGKSTLLKLLLGILPLQQGSIELFGQNLRYFKDWHLLGYVSQKATHFEKRFPATVWEIVAMGRTARRGLFKTLSEEDRAHTHKALEEAGMLHKKNTLLYELSGGEQQRVFIARALASNPRMLVLDEPTVGIDLKAQEQFYQLLQNLRQRKNLTIILVSHDIDVVATQASCFACLNQTLIYHGKPKDFFQQDYLEKLYGKNLRLILHGH